MTCWRDLTTSQRRQVIEFLARLFIDFNVLNAPKQELLSVSSIFTHRTVGYLTGVMGLSCQTARLVMNEIWDEYARATSCALN